MKCPECVQSNVKSNVYIGGSASTLMGHTDYYDEDGDFHSHNPNTITTSYSCSNGHEWTEKSKTSCPSCGTTI